MPIYPENVRQLDDTTVRATLHPHPPFDLGWSIKFIDDSGAVDQLDEINVGRRTLRRPLRVRDVVYITEIGPGDDDATVTLTVQAQDDHAAPDEDTLNHIVDRYNRRFFMDVDMDAVKKALSVDDYGKELVKAFWPLRPANYAGPWEALLKSLVHAQIFPSFASTLDQTLREQYGERVVFDGEPIRYFPRPIELAFAIEEDLRAFKFSRQKADYLVNISRAVLDDPVTYDFAAMRQMPGPDVVKLLSKLRGVGAWTSQNVAMRGLPHTDVFIDEKATRKAIAPYYSRDDDMNKREVAAAVERFAPYRTFACYYTYMKHFGVS